MEEALEGGKGKRWVVFFHLFFFFFSFSVCWTLRDGDSMKLDMSLFDSSYESSMLPF